MTAQRELITVGKAERQRFRERREELGLKQKDLGDRVGTTAATISNLETGRHPQIDKKLYARIKRALFRSTTSAAGAEETDDYWRTIVDGAMDLDAQAMKAVAALVQSLKKTD